MPAMPSHSIPQETVAVVDSQQSSESEATVEVVNIGCLDNTLKSVERIALGNGFDSFLMFNVYAQRATDPNAMERHCNQALHRENMAAFRYVLSISSAPAVWAAWGAIIEKRGYLTQCLRDMLQIGEEYAAHWYCAGAVTRKGHPHHPLYLKKDEKLKPFDIENYLDSLGENMCPFLI